MTKPILLAKGISKGRAELVKHFCSMKFAEKEFTMVKKKKSNDWSVYVSGMHGFNKNIKEVHEYVHEILYN